LPGSAGVEFKFIIKQEGQAVIWETGGNRTVSTPASGAFSVDGGWFRR
jgi:alpha-amylase